MRQWMESGESFFKIWLIFVVVLGVPSAIFRAVAAERIRKAQESPLGPIWAFCACIACLSAGLALLTVALERTDWLDYPDGGYSSEISIAALLFLAAGIVLMVRAVN